MWDGDGLMRVKRYVARTLPEATAQIRTDLGSQAVILHTRPVRREGIWGLFTPRLVEVVAAVEAAPTLAGQVAAANTWAAATLGAPTAPAAANTPTGAGAETSAPGVRKVAPAAAASAPALAAVSAPVAAFDTGKSTSAVTLLRPAGAGGSSASLGTAPARALIVEVLEPVRAEVARVAGALEELRRGITGATDAPDLPLYLQVLRQRLEARGIATELALNLVRRVQPDMSPGPDPAAAAAALVQGLIAGDVGEPLTLSGRSGPRRIVALVGPTGVGKTTTLAKLAAHCVLVERRQVAVCTADTYRIAAVQQLRTYCDIIGLPLEVVSSPDEANRALARQREADVVFVDTAGRSHTHKEQMAELGGFLQAFRPHETYLVLSLTSGTADNLAAAHTYGSIGYDRLLFTKLDEAAQPGTAYNVLMHTRRPASYVTTGQRVPDDIETADPQRLAAILLERAPL